MIQQSRNDEKEKYKKSSGQVTMRWSICLSYFTELFYCLYFILKPFYFRPSGTMQVADVCLGIAWVLYLAKCLIHGGFKNFKVMSPFYLFIIGVISVNTLYAVKLQDRGFLAATIYWIFNMIFLILSYAMLNDRGLLKKVILILELSIGVQFVIYIFHLGKWVWEIRYMGSFNDPNQFAFYMLACALCILLYEIYTKTYTIYGGLCILWAVFLIIKSASRGMTLCVALVIFFEAVIIFYGFLKKVKKRIKRKWLLWFTIGTIIMAAGFFVAVRHGNFSDTYNVWDRWECLCLCMSEDTCLLLVFPF